MAEEENKVDSLMNIWAHAIQIKNNEIAEIALEELDKIEIGEIKDKPGSLLTIWTRAMQIKNEKIAEIALTNLLNEIELFEKEDWINHQICGDYPKVDARCLVFCCSPKKKCPYRNTVLMKLGLDVNGYIEFKQKMADAIELTPK